MPFRGCGNLPLHLNKHLENMIQVLKTQGTLLNTAIAVNVIGQLL